MGAVTSRLTLQRIETALLSMAHLVDSVMRVIEHLLAAIVSRCFSRSIYAHFYVTPPKTGDAGAAEDNLTRVCTNDGVCYIPATRLEQHRALRKQKQEDRLKQRKMRAQWAAQGLDVQEMTRVERERKRRSRDGGDVVVMNKLSRSTTATTIDEKPDPMADTVGVVTRSAQAPPTIGSQSLDTDERSTRPTVRLLSSVREASSDFGAKVHMAESRPTRTLGECEEKRERRQSAPVPSFVHLKSKASVDAISASQILTPAAAINRLDKGHRHTSSMPIATPQDVVQPVTRKSKASSPSSYPHPTFTSPLGPALVQPKARRPPPLTMSDPAPCPSSAALARLVSATPPPPSQPQPAFLGRSSARTSFDLPSRPSSRAGTPGADDATSIRSKRSSLNGILRSASPGTPPPCVVQMADKACKSRSLSSAKERKEWKAEVKRIAVRQINERNHAAHRTSRPA